MKRRIVVLGAVAIASLATISTVSLAQRDQTLRKAFPGDCRTVLENSQKLTVFALGGEGDPRRNALFHNHAVVRQKQVTASRLKSRLVSALFQGITDPRASAKKCFDPHHGVRAERDGKALDLLICFDCETVYVFQGKDRLSFAPISDVPKALLDQALR